MTIEVTGCHDCKVKEFDYDENGYTCLGLFIDEYVEEERTHPSCPLKQETITIKLKEDDTTGVCKEES